MLEQELKNKIVNTLSQYKTKCDKLEDEISVLKSAIYSLSLLPNGIYVGVDRQMHNLQANLQENQNSTKIKKSVEHLVDAITNLQNRKEQSKAKIGDLVKHGTKLLSQIVSADDKYRFDKIEQLIRVDGDEQELLSRFMSLLEEAVHWITEQIASYQANEPAEPSINTQVNAKLIQLIEHLLIPENLKARINTLKDNLAEQLTIESLTNVVENLTELVIEAFNIEHNQFKEILNKFTIYLQNFGSYLQLANANNIQSQQASSQLEKDLDKNLQAIKGDMDEAETIEALSIKISKKLESIAEQMRAFRIEETERVKGYEEQILTLQSKLVEAESGVENIKQQLSVHKVKINEDPLTGLPNRSAYDEFILNAFNRWKRGFGEVTLALADIDHFKEINDRYGHLAGDKVLKKIAAILRESLRAVDFVGRYGGEEFIFIFEHTPAHEGWKVLENLRIAIEETEFCYRDQQVAVTASFGVTSLQHGDDIEALFVRTDQAMYQAKNGGRNRVIMV